MPFVEYRGERMPVLTEGPTSFSNSAAAALGTTPTEVSKIQAGDRLKRGKVTYP